MPLAQLPNATAPLETLFDNHPDRLHLTAFDQPSYLQLIQARSECITQVVAALKTPLSLSTSIDAGCGVGFFSETLRKCGLTVLGFDARRQNVREALRRFPEIAFQQADIEDPAVLSLGKSDLALCFGLLYHLENPMLAIRNLRALTAKALLLESMCVPDAHAALLLREEPRVEDQSLTDIALYPSESCLVKMLYRAGFASVYRLRELPDHEDFWETPEHARRRTVLLAFADSRVPHSQTFELLPEPGSRNDPWSKGLPLVPGASLRRRIWRFLKRPRRSQYISLMQRARRKHPALPLLLRTPFGFWWLAYDSALDDRLIHTTFEPRETKFMQQVLAPGMTVIDAGAHHGFYSLLASRLVGPNGRVIAFEPSARERRRWLAHKRVNGCHNTEMHACALGSENREGTLYIVEGREDWCNSLRQPAVSERFHTSPVRVRRLDDVLAELHVKRIDFLKLDVEGAELGVLRSARETLRLHRPAVLAEVQDVRTRAWGYKAQDVIDFLSSHDYCWFSISRSGGLVPVHAIPLFLNANLAALPKERIHEFQPTVGSAS